MAALRRFLQLAALTVATLALFTMAAAQAAESCPGNVAARRLPIVPATLAKDQVALTFVGHATFLIESPGGVTIATDYNDYVRPPATPDIVTMNKAHSTHYSDRPQPGIKQILRGWNPLGGPVHHNLTFGDVHIRNVPTNIRSWGTDETDMNGNSIFVFEMADLCIAHLGHLHHTLTPEHLRDLGRIDVLLVPVDGNYTLQVDEMMEVLRAINAPLMIPMHYFGPNTLARFLDRAQAQNYAVERSETPSITLSRATLPASPKILVLPGR